MFGARVVPEGVSGPGAWQLHPVLQPARIASVNQVTPCFYPDLAVGFKLKPTPCAVGA